MASIPGLALLVMVGGSASVATLLVLGRHPLGYRASAVASGMIVTCIGIAGFAALET